jgi:hypothetical protein
MTEIIYCGSTGLASTENVFNARQVGRCTYSPTLRRVRHRNAVSITHSEYVFLAIVKQHAARMCRIKLLGVACLAVRYFSTSSH